MAGWAGLIFGATVWSTAHAPWPTSLAYAVIGGGTSAAAVFLFTIVFNPHKEE